MGEVRNGQIGVGEAEEEMGAVCADEGDHEEPTNERQKQQEDQQQQQKDDNKHQQNDVPNRKESVGSEGTGHQDQQQLKLQHNNESNPKESHGVDNKGGNQYDQQKHSQQKNQSDEHDVPISKESENQRVINDVSVSSPPSPLHPSAENDLEADEVNNGHHVIAQQANDHGDGTMENITHLPASPPQQQSSMRNIPAAGELRRQDPIPQQRPLHDIPGAFRVVDSNDFALAARISDEYQHDSNDGGDDGNEDEGEDDTRTAISSLSGGVGIDNDGGTALLSAYPVDELEDELRRELRRRDNETDELRRSLNDSEIEKRELKRNLQRLQETTVRADEVRMVEPDPELPSQNDGHIEGHDAERSEELVQERCRCRFILATSFVLCLIIITGTATILLRSAVPGRLSGVVVEEVPVSSVPTPSVGTTPSTKAPSVPPSLLQPPSQPPKPLRCFPSGVELSAAVLAILGGQDVTSSSFAESFVMDTFGPIESWCVSLVEDFSFAFAYIDAFVDLDLTGWDTSAARTMGYMFEGSPGLNVNISTWNVSNVRTMRFMFSGASSFDDDLSSWDVSSVRTMEHMFSTGADTAYLEAPTMRFNGNISNWDVGEVRNMNNMFFGSTSFNRDISTWDVGQVTNMDKMFYGAESFQQDLCPWGKTMQLSHNATNETDDVSFRRMFTGTKCPNKDVDPSLNKEIPGPFCYECL